MMQADVQATFSDVSVVVARPTLISVPNMVSSLIATLEDKTISIAELAKLCETHPKETLLNFMKPSLDVALRVFQAAPLDIASQLMQLVQQFALIEYSVAQVPPTDDLKDGRMPTFGFGKLAQADVTERDRLLGVCPIPLFELNEQEVDTIASGASIDHAREILTRHQTLQYFFPAPDQTALGLIDRGIEQPEKVSEIVAAAPGLGHPFGPSEITTPRGVVDMIEALEEAGYVSEGELTLTVTEPGKEARAIVKYRPRESFISKLLNRLNINFDIHKLGGGSD
jgi:hypothetical protein